MTRFISLRSARGVTAVLILATFLAMSAAYLYLRGVRLGGDSERYIQGADLLLRGLPLQGKQWLYSGYIAIVAFFNCIGPGLPGLVAFQILVAIAAAYCLYRLGLILASPAVGLLAAALFLLNFEILRWHTYVLTDSLFISLVPIATYAVYAAGARPSFARSALALACLVIGASLRPSGWLLFPAAVIYWMIQSPSARTKRWLALLLAVLLLLIYIVPHLASAVQSESVAELLAEGVVIWGYEDWNVHMPAGGLSAASPLSDVLGYAIQHPVATLRLAAWRVATALAHARPYHSPVRNALSLAYLLPVYGFALVAAVSRRREPLVCLVGLMIGSQLLLIAATFADWDGRFLLYFLPLIQLLAAGTVVQAVGPIRSRFGSREPGADSRPPGN